MDKLLFLQSQFSDLPRQGTDAWLASRRTKVGGSEIAAVAGVCPYRSRAKLIASKRAMVPLRAAPCTFGRIMEEVAKRVLVDETGHTIHEMGAIPATRVPMCYSPDGLIVDGDDLVLLEIKCPFRRRKLGTVAPHYRCQVQAGMNILPCDRCMFLQYRFRLCRAADLGPSPAYNRWLHCEGRRSCPDVPPMRWGYIHFDADTDLIDLGALGADTADKLCIVDRLTARLVFEEKDMPDTGYVVPWKLFDQSRVDIARDPAFLDTHTDGLWSVHRELTAAAETTAESEGPPPLERSPAPTES